jgi:ribosomal protein L16 Arg81 hydroxylase
MKQRLNKNIFSKINENKTYPFFLKKAFDCQQIISWKDLENYLNNPYIHSDDIEIIDNNGFKLSLNKIYTPYTQQYKISPAQIFDLINKNYSFILLNMNRFNEKMNDLAIEVEENIEDDIQLDFHLYCGIDSDSKSFKAHSDLSHNIIMQVEGISRWKIWDWNTGCQSMIPKNKESTAEIIIDEMLTPGDILYIPAGIVHKCIPQGKRISISSCWQTLDSYEHFTLKSFYGDRTWYTFTK